MDDYYGSGGADSAGSASPLDPTGKPAPQLQATDALDMAQPSIAITAPAIAIAEPAAPVAAAPVATVASAPVAVAVASAPVAAPAPVPSLAPTPAAPAPVSPVPASQEMPAQAVPSMAPPITSELAAAPAAVAVPASSVAESGGTRIGAEDNSEDSSFLSNLLLHVLDHNASDLHLTVGARPTVRLSGHLKQLEDYPILTPQMVQRTMYAIMSQKQREKFEEELELDFAYSLPGRARFRVNLYKQRDALGAAFRLIPYEIKKLEDLGVPPSVSNFAMLPRGFVLVTGPTGSGKSTTLAAIVDMANRQRADHIMTVEDPIEFLHTHKSCLVNQREVGEDTWSFKNALKHVLRQDPDIILVGEMRDLETIEIALTAAETGHLVMATLHTMDAAK